MGRQAGKSTGAMVNKGSQSVTSDRGREDKVLSSDIQGRNSLQGSDQHDVRNQRHAVPDQKSEPDASVVESFEKMDPKKR